MRRPRWPLTDTRSISKPRSFDPACDGFGVRNPVGRMPDRTGGGGILRRFDAFVYWKGLCFGMSFAAPFYFMNGAAGTHHRPLSEVPLTPGLIALLRRHQLRQCYPRTMLYVVWFWLASGGGKPGRASDRLRLVGGEPRPVRTVLWAVFQSEVLLLSRAGAFGGAVLG